MRLTIGTAAAATSGWKNGSQAPVDTPRFVGEACSLLERRHRRNRLDSGPLVHGARQNPAILAGVISAVAPENSRTRRDRPPLGDLRSIPRGFFSGGWACCDERLAWSLR